MGYRVGNRAVRRSLSSVLALALVASVLMIAPGASAVLVNDNITSATPVVSGGTLAETSTVGPIGETHRVYSIDLAAGDILNVGGGYGGSPQANAGIRVLDPTATDVSTATPLAQSTETTPAQRDVQYTATAAGKYFIDVVYRTDFAVAWTFQVHVAGGAPTQITPDVTFEPDIVNFDATVDAPPPASQTITVTIGGWQTPVVSWYLYNIPSWLTITPSGGDAPGTTAMQISVDTSGLAVGDYSQDIQVAVNVPSIPASFPSAFSSMSSGFFGIAGMPVSYGTLPVQLSVALPKIDSEIVSFTVSPTSPTRTSSTLPKTTITGGLRAVGAVVDPGTALASQQIDIWQSYNDSSFTKVAVATTDANGNFSLSRFVSKKTYFKATFGGNDVLNASPVSTHKVVLPGAYVTKPGTPSTVYKGRSFTTAGYIYPVHTSTYPVKLQFYRRERQTNGTYKWVYRKYAYGKRLTTGSAYVKWSVSTSLPATGSWKVIAVHTDTDHRSSSSAYRFFTAQ